MTGVAIHIDQLWFQTPGGIGTYIRTSCRPWPGGTPAWTSGCSTPGSTAKSRGRLWLKDREAVTRGDQRAWASLVSVLCVSGRW